MTQIAPKENTPKTVPTPELKKALEKAKTVNGQKEIRMEDDRPRTPGDTFYDVTQFLIGKLFILGMTAALAFTAHDRFGPDKIGPVPNYLKKLQRAVNKLVKPLQEYGSEKSRKRDLGILLGEGAKATVILSWGGNFFAPFIKTLENRRMEITNWYNKKFGTPEDVEITKEKYADMPKQNWKDVLKGRAWAYATVFGSLTAAYLGFNRSSHFPQNSSHRFRLQTWEEWGGRFFAWMKKDSRKLFKGVKVGEKLTEAQERSWMYRFGKIVAIDVFATSMGILVWNTVSRLSAKKRVKRERELLEQGREDAVHEIVQELPNKTSFTDKIEPRQRVNTASPKEGGQSFANILAEQRALAEQSQTPALSS